ncbi:GMC family oxidoreductase N-terminal domain-containing protein [Arthrobacter sp. FW305-BF8]|uniref:GMC family oxidoreductase n=1 Tax=Arthrobacter sp. FW305-BF8 TaxID=2879617 RepID=UPI001F466E95|nr:GMC family oxidoreductase N-terminal domain-containing protein [Arthrobacter sp. FW305-BF8]UKA55230.1 GMC family oxidoreductase N-terminal domain-containing protein [Arthrobacter sp. FW305-BF8]
MKAQYDVLIVGAGAAGAPLASRLSEDPQRSVLLLEAGPTPNNSKEYPPELLNAGTVQGAAPGHPNNWSFSGYLTADRPYSIARGRILGGSTAISGTYFIRAPKQDFDQWSSAGNDEWSWNRVLPLYKRLENDLQFGHTTNHGHHGPVPVSRLRQSHPATTAFARAVKELGFPEEADKNNGGPPGYGPMPTNSIGGQRIDTGSAYINPVRGRPNLTVQGNSYVRRVLFNGRRAIGVEVLHAGVLTTIEADEVVLSAGAVKTPHILLLSGLGPAAELKRFGIPVINDLAGVGRDFSDHPNLAITWRPRIPLIDYSSTQAMADVLNFTATGSSWVGDLEIIQLLKPMSYMLTGVATSAGGRPPTGAAKASVGLSPHHSSHGVHHEGELAFLVSLQAETSRGHLSLASADPEVQPQIHFNYLSTESDRSRMREAVRTSTRLLQSNAYSAIFQEFTQLDENALQSDELLDAWVRAHLGTALHLCGTAKFGSPEDPATVVDPYGRVHGVKGLRIADTSILPTAPRRGPAATAVLIGERIADFMRRQL